MEPKKIAHLFAGWEETMIWSYLQGCMGYALVDNEIAPESAQIVVGDICFFAGVPNQSLAQKAAAPIIAPKNAAWSKLIEAEWGDRVEPHVRYAIKKEPDCFDVSKLTAFVQGLHSPYVFQQMDRALYEQAMGENWSKDLCAQFADADDYLRRGLGIAITLEGVLVAGASSYTVYRGGIEIEIDTKPEFRQRGLATVCGAGLILACLRQGLYPSWDAHDMRSVSLAQKLGYHLDQPYPVYLKKETS